METKPTPQTVYLHGVPINLSLIARATGADHSYLSRIFMGERTARTPYLRRIAAALKMSLTALIEGLDAKAAPAKKP